MRKIILLVSIVFLFSCAKKNISWSGEKGKIINLTGLDSCSWVIELENGKRLEPINLSKFDITIKDGLEVYLEYHIVKNIVSSCMVGEIIQIERIEER